MKPWRIVTPVLIAVLFLPANFPAAAAPQQEKQVSSFKDFKLLTERNIFDSSRSSHRPGDEAERPSQKPTQVDRIALVGAFLHDRERVVFFLGSESKLSGTYRVGDSIGEFKILAIDTDKVRLQANDREIELPMGWALSRSGDRTWEMAKAESVTPPDAASPSGEKNDTESKAGSSAESKSGSSATTKPSPGSADDVLKRMRERRERETQ